MQLTGTLDSVTDRPRWVVVCHPTHLAVVTEIQNTLNDVASMTLRVNRFRIYIPEERLAEFDLLDTPAGAFHIGSIA